MRNIKEETGDYSYYEVVFGNQMAVVRTDWPTTDYGAITDILIDNLEKDGSVGSPYLLDIDTAEKEYNEDEYVIGGNHGLALIHNGNFQIRPIPAQDAKRYQKNDNISLYTESKNKRGFIMDNKGINESVNKILNGGNIKQSIMESESDKDKTELIHALNDLVNAHSHVLEVYDKLEDTMGDEIRDIFATKYPYDKSFDDLLLDVCYWRDSVYELTVKQ